MSTDEQGLKPGDQIAYIPTHAKGDITHPDVEFGFITSMVPQTACCRYWRKDLTGLRTKANSKLTPIAMLTLHTSVSKNMLEGACAIYDIVIK